MRTRRSQPPALSNKTHQTNRMRRIIVIVVIVAFAAGVAVGVLWSDRVNAPTISATGSTSSDGSAGGTGAGPDTGATNGTNDTEQQGIPSTATEASVEFVYDGDTIFLVDGRKVRLLGIDTPEIGDNLECYGDEATALLRKLLPEGTHVWVQPDVDPLDRYGRSLLFIYTDAGTNINLELVRQGAAEVVQYDPNFLLQPELRAAETAARDARLGLWEACG
jgi:endonuclease YncB( thermonuclease family)